MLWLFSLSLYHFPSLLQGSLLASFLLHEKKQVLKHSWSFFNLSTQEEEASESFEFVTSLVYRVTPELRREAWSQKHTCKGVGSFRGWRWSLNGLLCKHDDPDLIPRTQIIKSGTGVYTCAPSTAEAETGPWAFRPAWPSQQVPGTGSCPEGQRCWLSSHTIYL